MMHNKIKRSLAKILYNASLELYPHLHVTEEELYALLVMAPRIDLGHFTFPCFSYAKLLKTSPAAVALNFSKKIKEKVHITRADPMGPYLNIKINIQVWGETIDDILSGTYFKRCLIKKPSKIMIEFSQPNTHKILHVGHLRNICLGNSLVKLNQYLDHDVVSATYLGDLGTHIAKCLWYINSHARHKYQNLTGTEAQKGTWLGEIYEMACNALEDENTDQNKKQLTLILKEITKRSGTFFVMWKKTRAWSLSLLREIYEWGDIQFDHWFFESKVDAPSIKLIDNYYKNNILIKDQGAIGIDLSDEQLGFCMLLKSDGTGLYSTKDIQLAKIKFEEFNIEKNIYIVDKRQSYHFQQIFNVLKKIGFPYADQCYHLAYDVVELSDGPLSSRKGHTLPLKEVITLMEERITLNFLQKYRTLWPEEEIRDTARILANGALKYGMLRIDNSRKIIFNIDQWLNLNGETGPYLQYVSVRINSLCEKNNFNIQDPVDWSTLTSPYEEELLVKLNFFNDMIERSGAQLKTMIPCAYLYELGKSFNVFYAHCSISKSESKSLKFSRLALAYAVGKIIKKGLNLLGISTPRRM